MIKKDIEKLAELGEQYVKNELDTKIGDAQQTFSNYRHQFIYENIGKIPSKEDSKEKINNLMRYCNTASSWGVEPNEIQEKQINNLKYILENILK